MTDPVVVPWFLVIPLLLSCAFIELELCLLFTRPFAWFRVFLIFPWIGIAVLSWYCARDHHARKLEIMRARQKQEALFKSMDHTMNKVMTDLYNKHFGKLP